MLSAKYQKGHMPKLCDPLFVEMMGEFLQASFLLFVTRSLNFTIAISSLLKRSWLRKLLYWSVVRSQMLPMYFIVTLLPTYIIREH